MIRQANKSGADIVKTQYFCPECSFKYGSMPLEFYRKCFLKELEIMNLVEYARDIGNDLFFSVCEHHKGLSGRMLYEKQTASQSKSMYRIGWPDWKLMDKDNVIVSIPKDCSLPKFKKAEVLFASGYLEKVDLENIKTLSCLINRNVGYSDHTLGIDKCIEARLKYQSEIIEKHFVIENDAQYRGQVFRDTVHGVKPKEFERLANKIN